MAIIYVNLFKKAEVIFISPAGILNCSDIIEQKTAVRYDLKVCRFHDEAGSRHIYSEVYMASDSIKRISEAEEQSLRIEHEADSAAALILADAERNAREKAAVIDRETDEEVRHILFDAEEARREKESGAIRIAAEESESLRADISPRIPEAVKAVRELLIGKV